MLKIALCFVVLLQFGYSLKVPALSSQIVNGDDAILGRYPWQVFLDLGPNAQCGGTLIADDWVLTAAHCLGGSAPRNVMFGTIYRNGTGKYTQNRNISYSCCHKDFSYRTWANDICLIKLASPVSINLYTTKATLPDKNLVLSNEKSPVCYATGWGRKEDGMVADVLQEGQMSIINLTSCNAWYAEDRMEIPQSHLCAGNVQGGVDTCVGDSGGPLVCTSENGWILYGITSFGHHRCGMAKRPGIYTRVDIFLDWIKKKMSQTQCEVFHWGPWTGSCSVTCGVGERKRKRACLNEDNGMVSTELCSPGSDEEVSECNQDPCKHYHWGKWKAKCSVTCGTGTKTRTRKCLDEKNVPVDQKLCGEGLATQLGNCTNAICVTINRPYQWSSWKASKCSVTCGAGIERRSRVCRDGEKRLVPSIRCFPGRGTKTTECKLAACKESPLPVHYLWGEWKRACGVTCGSGVELRNRDCQDEEKRVVSPSKCGSGKHSEKGTCVNIECPSFHWGAWVDTCSVTCGNGIRTKRRSCLDAKQNIVSPATKCKPGKITEKETCFQRKCPEYKWAEWKVSCSVTCGTGIETRSRDCLDEDNRIIKDSTKCKQGKSVDKRKCTQNDCIVYQWGPWKNSCSVTCGSGIKTKLRKCYINKNQTVDDVSKCKPGRNRIVGKCSRKKCIEYHWSVWASSVCSVTCGRGIIVRKRICLDNHGKKTDVENCKTGSDSYQEECVMKKCIEYHWSSWSKAECSVTCGQGNIVRKRNCLGDENKVVDTKMCTEGSNTLSEKCQVDDCPDYHWSVWSAPVCSVTCGRGTRVKKRICLDAKEKITDVTNCKSGSDTSLDECSLDTCDVYHWGSWKVGSCSVTCGRGVETKNRDCLDKDERIVLPSNKCKPGVDTESRACQKSDCPDYHWSSWKINPCSVSCGKGLKTEERHCLDSKGKIVLPYSKCGKEPYRNYGTCYQRPCNDYHWSQWTYSLCSVTCGIGQLTRSRDCLDQNNAVVSSSKCETGVSISVEQCRNEKCVEYHWSPWASTRCSVTCGTGVKTKRRECLDGTNFVSSKLCNGEEKEIKESCFNKCVEYRWGPWKTSPCTVTCGIGSATRIRDCFDDLNRVVLGSHCRPGYNMEEIGCQQEACLTSPSSFWGKWGHWSSCRVSFFDPDPCNGFRSRIRSCENKWNQEVDSSDCVVKGSSKDENYSSESCLPDGCNKLLEETQDRDEK